MFHCLLQADFLSTTFNMCELELPPNVFLCISILKEFFGDIFVLLFLAGIKQNLCSIWLQMPFQPLLCFWESLDKDLTMFNKGSELPSWYLKELMNHVIKLI